MRYVDGGLIETDDDAAEREIRPMVLGRHCLFAGSDAGGERTTMRYRLLNTAKLNELHPEGRPRDVLARIVGHPVNQIGEPLPWRSVEATEPVSSQISRPSIGVLAVRPCSVRSRSMQHVALLKRSDRSLPHVLAAPQVCHRAFGGAGSP